MDLVVLIDHVRVFVDGLYINRDELGQFVAYFRAATIDLVDPALGASDNKLEELVSLHRAPESLRIVLSRGSDEAQFQLRPAQFVLVVRNHFGCFINEVDIVPHVFPTNLWVFVTCTL